MPVCPRCGVGYLDSETHRCAPRTTEAKVFFGIMVAVALLTVIFSSGWLSMPVVYWIAGLLFKHH
jgi:hypothetical protein